jgi:hypothetical protein
LHLLQLGSKSFTAHNHLSDSSYARKRCLGRTGPCPRVDGSPGEPGLRLIERPELAEYYRDYHQTVAGGLADWEERGRDRLFHGATAVVIVGSAAGGSCPASRVGAFGRELGGRGRLGSAVGTRPRQSRGALLAKLRARAVLTLTLRAFHIELPWLVVGLNMGIRALRGKPSAGQRDFFGTSASGHAYGKKL